MSSAIISPCGTYRYNLTRTVQAQGVRASIIMVNPSTADAIENDQTIKKCIGFSERNGWREFTVVNKFAFRATDVRELHDADDPIGPFNDAFILAALMSSDVTLVAWGRLAKIPIRLWRRWRDIYTLAQQVQRPLYCLGVCADGHPRHPQMLGYDTPLELWNPPYA